MKDIDLNIWIPACLFTLCFVPVLAVAVSYVVRAFL